MMKWMIAAAAALLFAACGPSRGKTPRAEEKQQEKESTGGYTQQRAPTAEETALFDAATRGVTGVAYTPQSVATQIVAGTNYRFICTAVTATAEPRAYKAAVTIFVPLPGRGEPKITAITPL